MNKNNKQRDRKIMKAVYLLVAVAFLILGLVQLFTAPNSAEYPAFFNKLDICLFVGECLIGMSLGVIGLHQCRLEESLDKIEKRLDEPKDDEEHDQGL